MTKERPQTEPDDVMLAKYLVEMKVHTEMEGHFGNLKYDSFNIGHGNNLL